MLKTLSVSKKVGPKIYPLPKLSDKSGVQRIIDCFKDIWASHQVLTILPNGTLSYTNLNRILSPPSHKEIYRQLESALKTQGERDYNIKTKPESCLWPITEESKTVYLTLPTLNVKRLNPDVFIQIDSGQAQTGNQLFRYLSTVSQKLHERSYHKAAHPKYIFWRLPLASPTIFPIKNIPYLKHLLLPITVGNEHNDFFDGLTHAGLSYNAIAADLPLLKEMIRTNPLIKTQLSKLSSYMNANKSTPNTRLVGMHFRGGDVGYIREGVRNDLMHPSFFIKSYQDIRKKHPDQTIQIIIFGSPKEEYMLQAIKEALLHAGKQDTRLTVDTESDFFKQFPGYGQCELEVMMALSQLDDLALGSSTFAASSAFFGKQPHFYFTKVGPGYPTFEACSPPLPGVSITEKLDPSVQRLYGRCGRAVITQSDQNSEISNPIRIGHAEIEWILDLLRQGKSIVDVDPQESLLHLQRNSKQCWHTDIEQTLGTLTQALGQSNTSYSGPSESAVKTLVDAKQQVDAIHAELAPVFQTLWAKHSQLFPENSSKTYPLTIIVLDKYRGPIHSSLTVDASLLSWYIQELEQQEYSRIYPKSNAEKTLVNALDNNKAQLKGPLEPMMQLLRGQRRAIIQVREVHDEKKRQIFAEVRKTLRPDLDKDDHAPTLINLGYAEVFWYLEHLEKGSDFQTLDIDDEAKHVGTAHGFCDNSHFKRTFTVMIHVLRDKKYHFEGPSASAMTLLRKATLHPKATNFLTLKRQLLDSLIQPYSVFSSLSATYRDKGEPFPMKLVSSESEYSPQTTPKRNSMGQWQVQHRAESFGRAIPPWKSIVTDLDYRY